MAEAAAIDLLAAGTGVSAASSARPGPNERRVRDTELRTRWVRADELRVTGSADASTRCRQCAGSAVTVQVVYAYGTERLTVRNTARASASCVTCGSSALSVQVVVTDVPVGRDLVVSNAATATGTWCLGCTSAAAAVQVVVEDPQLRQLDEAGRTRLAGVGADMGVLLARTATDSAQARWRLTAGEVTERLQADGRRLVLILREELGGTVVSQGIVVRMA